MVEMKKIGLIGGVTWASTIDYYRAINQKVNHRFGGYHTAEVLINSVNFNTVMDHLKAGNWKGVEDLFTAKALELKKAGVDFFAISSNTIAKVANDVSRHAELPLINIIKCTAKEISKKGFTRAGFLGTRFTMQSSFYFDELREYGIDAVLPSPKEISGINNIIMNELAQHVINEKSKDYILQIIESMVKYNGVGGIILGCTEMPLLLGQNDTDIPLFDTTDIHTDYIVDYALETNS